MRYVWNFFLQEPSSKKINYYMKSTYLIISTKYVV
jgi:hypothetical protein